ncbi:hypothetical protein GGI05_000108 [Coemansia sp. RSA 2603]|nr:hypothetical protein GGI05_000108 [Coemansia sp. RSA 2603]
MAKDTDATPRNSESIDDEMRRLKIQDAGVDRAEDIQVDSDQNKFSAMLGILRKVAGVSDVINL